MDLYFRNSRKVAEAAANSLTNCTEQCGFVRAGQSIVVLFQAPGQKVVCTLKELNKYRHYLTSLKLEFERNYIREQKIIEEQINKLCETKRVHENSRFHKWLLQESTQATPDQKLLIKNRYIDMISRQLDKAENQNRLQMKEEERHHQDHIRRKLSLHKQIEEKCVLLEKKMAYHLQKCKGMTLTEKDEREGYLKAKNKVNQKSQILEVPKVVLLEKIKAR